MKITSQKLSRSQVELKIEVPAEEFKTFMDKAVLDIGKEIEIEGFRKGKAPKEIIERTVGQEKILKTAGEDCIKENYVKAILENKIEPLGQPEIEILKAAPGNPFEFKAKVSILPEVKLPDYKEIASQIKKQEVKVTQEEIEKLRTEKERIEKEKRRNEILEKIAEKTEIELPEVLVEAEKKRMLENLKQQISQMLQINFEDYLKKINKTEKELLDSFLPEAEKRVRNSLILKEIEEKEKIEVSEDELKNETERFLKTFPDAKDFDPEKLKEYTKEVIRNEKAFQLLENLLNQPRKQNF